MTPQPGADQSRHVGYAAAASQSPGANALAARRQFGLRSIRHKISLGMLLTTMTALLILGTAIIVYDLGDFRERTLLDLRTQADLLGQASAAALQFDDPEVAGQQLDLLRLRPQVLAAAIYRANGERFAHYTVDGIPTTVLPELQGSAAFLIEDDRLNLSRQITFEHEILGSIWLLAHYPYHERLWRQISIVFGVAVLALAVSMLISLWIQARVTRPVLQITELAHQVIEQRNFNLRAQSTTDDEIGYLVLAFNNMLSEIGRSSVAMEASNQRLSAEVQERIEAERALRDSELRHRVLVTTLTAVVWRANANGDFFVEQPAWDRYTGQSPDNHASQGWLAVVHDEDRPELARRWRLARETVSPFSTEMRLWHAASGDYRYVNLRAVPLQGADGRTLEWMGIIDDIHERVRSSEQIRQLNADLEQRVQARTAELENANQELEAFSYSVSHDLRAPLRSIDGFSQALLEDYIQVLDESGQDYLTRVRAAAQRMGGLIDDLLKLSRVSRVELDQGTLDLSAMAEEIVAGFKESDPQREVEVRITSGLSGYGDARLLRVALENLLNNAWKYTGKRDPARIEFGMRDYQGTPSYFIQDNGAGFDMAYVDHLFGAFQRLHDARDYPGTGVGLATVQRIIRRHGGRIWAEAEVGKGAVFYFTLSPPREAAPGETS
jgi:PAS domain S-box-containing protein